MFRKLVYIIYQPYKWFFYLPFLALNTIIFGVLAVVFSVIFNPRIGSYIGGVIWARVNSFLVPMFVCVEGRENIDKKTSYIVLTNHQSAYDIFLIYGWLGIDIKWIMKRELRKIPGIGFGSEKVGHIFIDRSNSRSAIKTLEIAKTKLVNGTSVVVFPEGTRSKSGNPGPFKRGAFKLALDLDLPILPISLVNTRNILPPNSLNILPGKVKMIIHKPIDISEYSADNMSDLIMITKDMITKELPHYSE